VVENIAGNSADGSAYHGYWAQNIEQVNTNFGTAADLVALSSAVHEAGMYFMVDIVTNHMAYLGCGTCVDYSIYTPFNSVCLRPYKIQTHELTLLGIILPSVLPH
jgi:alpha-amylase